MRLAFVVPRCTTDNSHGRYVLGITRTLGDAHEVHVISSAFPPHQDAIPTVCHKVRLPNWPTLARLATWWTAAPFLVRPKQFDIVHTIGADAPGAQVVTAPCCNRAIRHAMEASGAFEGQAGRPSYLARFTQWSAELADRTSMIHAERVLAPSLKVAGEVHTLYGVSTQKTVIVPWGVDLNAFSPGSRLARRRSARQSLGLSADTFVCLFVGGAYRLKGLLPLLKAVRSMAHLALRLIAAGVTADTELERQLSNGLADRVILKGPGSAMLDLYAAADVFVLPTLYDGFSLATLEAMACGLPVIVSRCAGISDLLVDHQNAILLNNPSSAQEIQSALGMMLDDPRLRDKMGLCARQKAERLGWPEIARQVLVVYDDIISRRRHVA